MTAEEEVSRKMTVEEEESRKTTQYPVKVHVSDHYIDSYTN